MSTYGASGDNEPTDPWTDETVRVPPPVTPAASAPVPPVATPAAAPQSVPPAPQSVPPAPEWAPPATYPQAPQPATFAPGQAPYQPPQPAYQPPPPAYQPPQQPYAAPQEYQPQEYQPGYAQQPAYGQAQPYAAPQAYEEQQQWAPPPKQRSVILPVLLTLLAVVVVAGIGVGIYWYAHRTTTVAEVVPPTDACVVSNNLARPNTKLTQVQCTTPGSFKVLRSQTNTVAKSACDGVANVSDIFTFTADGPPGVDYVLCLKKN